MSSDNDNKGPDSKSKPIKGRLVYVLLVALFPVIFPGLISAAVQLFIAEEPQEQIASQSEFVSIDYPLTNSNISSNTEINGRVLKAMTGYSYYLTTSVQKLHWPKKLLPNYSSSWNHNLSSETEDSFNISVIAVNEEGKKAIEQWFAHGSKTGEYPGLSDLPGLKVIAQVAVRR